MIDRRTMLGPIVGIAIAGAALPVFVLAAAAEESVKIGVILPMTGPFQSTGAEADAAIKLFLQQHGTAVADKRVQTCCQG